MESERLGGLDMYSGMDFDIPGGAKSIVHFCFDRAWFIERDVRRGLKLAYAIYAVFATP